MIQLLLASVLALLGATRLSGFSGGMQGGDYFIFDGSNLYPLDPSVEGDILQTLSDMLDFATDPTGPGGPTGGPGGGPGAGNIPCGHYTSLAQAVTKLLDDYASGQRSFGGITSQGGPPGAIGATDGNSLGVHSGMLNPMVPQGDLWADLWHEAQHSYHADGKINNCDHAELFDCTAMLADALRAAGINTSATASVLAMQNAADYRGRCNW